ncbi:MAG: YcgL domain-containing protein [Thiomicrospira sp.]|uniref:YcgL domain-containing protein n=1 Tax=Thiomicrospira sp. TaxID=935 RepID=UPI0019DDE352|nr:YcgL domain-containing protein [Thiomicrospira sp.]MBE0492845.1 YcgL domain-containing protein [Thiomicrospira sp.]
MQPMQVSAYKSPKKNELFLFIPQVSGLDELPKELLVMFGKPEHVIDFELTQDRKMGREDAKQVLENLHSKGYYMQMPPNEIEKISDMPPPPERLDNIF